MNPASQLGLDVLAAAVVTGAGLGAPLVRHGLRQLSVSDDRAAVRIAAPVAVAVGGAGAVLATDRAGSWWLLPAMLVWGYTLTACGACDALTQRIPTPLVRQAIVIVIALLALGSWPAHQERHVLLAFAASACAGLIMLACWRFLGAGFGDVRLAGLGGLGLGHATVSGLILGVALFALLIFAQTVRAGTRHERHAHIPYGPALAIGFLLAAALPAA